MYGRVYMHMYLCVCLGHSCFPLRNYTTEFLGENVAIHYICLQQWMGKREIIFLFSFSFHFDSIFFFYPSNFWSSVVCFFFSPMHIAFTTHRSLIPIPATIFHSYCCFAIDKWAKKLAKKKRMGKVADMVKIANTSTRTQTSSETKTHKHTHIYRM